MGYKRVVFLTPIDNLSLSLSHVLEGSLLLIRLSMYMVKEGRSGCLHTWFYLLHHRHQCIRNLLRSRERVRIAGRWTDMYLFWVYMSCHVCFLGIHVTYLLWVYASFHVSFLRIRVMSRASFLGILVV